ncbi:MAG: glycoside hydrolase family 15 protein [Spirochaetes bacterium]|nr:glycoside hydrolase family 15 protein [Spirochaetota bacterium]
MTKRRLKKNYHYGFIGNCTSGALVSDNGSIDWLCLPYFDSPSLFAGILDKEKGGHFKISGIKATFINQEYIRHTGILKTIFSTPSGKFEVNDYLPRYQLQDQTYYCPDDVHRFIRIISGKPKIKIELKAKPNYAIGPAKIEMRRDYIKIMSQFGEYDSFYLYTNLEMEKVVKGNIITLESDAYFLLSYHQKLERVDLDKIYFDYQKTKTYWLDWVSRTFCPQNYREQVIRSAITLKMLSYQRTGAVIASPTTSLPEIIGKDRNWDYRYCWIRDASKIIDLYARINHTNSATRFMDFILDRRPRKHENMRTIYGINGEKDLVERILTHLSGYEGSKPVRIGNDAYLQKQNDLYGELIETIYTFLLVNKRSSFPFQEELWTLVRSLVRDVIDNWHIPDSGIWERRQAIHHYVHSKLMNWVALDRAVKIAGHFGKTEYIRPWSALAEKIKAEIIENGWNEKARSFTMYYGSKSLDASNLLMLHYGFLDRNDPRMKSTVEQTYKHLVYNGFTFRYKEKDEFGKPENAFIICCFWMINSLYLIGKKDEAINMFENLLKYSNHLGLLSEGIEIATGRLVGNFPQGYSHLSLIQTVFLLETEYNWNVRPIVNYNRERS